MKKLLIIPVFLLMMPLSLGAATGDVNNDGCVDINDVVLLIDRVLGTADSMSLPSTACDINGDGEIAVDDVTLLIDRLLAGVVPEHEEMVLTANGVQFTMVLVKSGTFTMGATPEQTDVAGRNEYPAHEVSITFDYYIGQTEVTQELWLAVMGENPSTFAGDLQRPVECVSHFACAIFLDRLTAMTGRIFRLPTEAEWEYAARGGQFSRQFIYAGSDDYSAVAWCDEEVEGSTHPVGMLEPNELGLFDMSGNVSEWCQDWYSGYDSAPQINPCGPESGTDNVYRGGSWCSSPRGCRVSSRYDLTPYGKSSDLGLRLVMNP